MMTEPTRHFSGWFQFAGEQHSETDGAGEDPLPARTLRPILDQCYLTIQVTQKREQKQHETKQKQNKNKKKTKEITPHFNES